MTLTPRELLEQDQGLQALEQVKKLPRDDEDWTLIQKHLAHAQSPDAYQEYYRTMRGGICPESDVFSRHRFVKRFAAIRRRVLERKHKTVLDLGCLDGWQLLNLAVQGVTGVGVDLCAQALAVAGERSAKWGLGLKFIEASIEDLDLKPLKGFDAVLLSEVLEHVLDPLSCLKTAVRHLAPGGIVYISVPASPIPHHGKLEDAREHLRVLSEGELKFSAKEAGLAVVQDHEVLQEEDQGQPYSHRMISFRRAQIVIYCNHVTGGWSPEDMDRIGASEEMVVKVAESWVRRGHEVTVHQNGYEGAWKGVTYRSRAIAPEPNRDLLVLFKTLEHADQPAQSRVFWTTDLPLPGQTASFLPPRVADELDGVICISEYHREELLKACPWLDPKKTTAHWLGIDKEEVQRACEQVQKVPGRVIYASSPDRGLSHLLEMWPRIVRRCPNASLHVLYGFEFWKRSEAVLPAAQASQMQAERERLETLVKILPNVVYLGHLPREEFLRELAQASVWGYPCTGGELCCKVGLEAQAGGCLPVVIPTMAVGETVQAGRKVSSADFEEALISALSHPPSDDWQSGIHIPSWEDLSTVFQEFLPAYGHEPEHAQTATGSSFLMDSGASEQLPQIFDSPRSTGGLASTTRLDIVLAVAGMPFDGNTDRERNLGGSETVALQLSRELARRGHRVSVFSNLPGQPGRFDGVSYLPLSEWAKYVSSACHDVSIVQREPMAFNQQLRSKLNILWCHDLGLCRYRSTFRPSLWNVDYVVPVSHWHGAQLAKVYELPAPLIVPLYNGIDLDLVAKSIAGAPIRNEKALIYASRPERGLDLLLESIFPRLLERDPELTLYIAGYENTLPEMEAFYLYCQQLIANLGTRAKWLGGLSKPDLYRLYSRGAAYIYPSRNFDEVFCVTAAEAAACGLPFVATTLGALPEVTGKIPGFASLVEHPGQATESFVSEFTESVWKVLSNSQMRENMSRAGRGGASVYSWEVVAREWEDFLFGALELRSKNRQRLVRHWWRLGDLRGIEHLSEDDQALLAPAQQKELMDSPVDTPPTNLPSHIPTAIAQIIVESGAKSVSGVDPTDKNLLRTIADLANAQIVEEGADFVLGVETLECAEDPGMHIELAESLAKVGGSVCLITASPGVYQDRLCQGESRRKRWVFDNHDMREVLQNKLNLLSIIIGGGAVSAWDKQPLSWMLYQWTRPSVTSPRTSLDMSRRTVLQAPQPSVSGCLIVKNAENMLHRCIKSIRPYCDEIIVDDNGSTDSTKDILRSYGIDPGTGPNPIAVGFDEARNVNIARATGDFILWIDADEELLNGSCLPKYLRWSLYDGFGISQHHFSADPANAFKPDLPVRIFRRVHLNGKPTGIRFWGVVHEHPEVALNHSVGQSIVLSDIHIAHEGYMIEDVRRKRFLRNIPLMFRDRIKYPDRVLGKFLMIRDWCHLARYSIEKNHNGLTPEAVHYLEAALAQYQKDFLGLTHVIALEGLQYYNEALRMLNRGFEVQLALKIGGLDGVPHELSYSGRMASEKDLDQLLTGSTRDLTGFCREKYL